MALVLKWSPEAIEDIEHHAQFIERDSPYYAAVVVSKIVDALEMCRKHPHIGRQVPEIENPAYRERIIYRFRVIDRLYEEHILVVAIIHGSRNFQPHISRITNAPDT